MKRSFFSKIGFSAYFPKPATTSDLLDALAIVVNSSEALQQVPIVTHSYLQTFKRKESLQKNSPIKWQNPTETTVS